MSEKRNRRLYIPEFKVCEAAEQIPGESTVAELNGCSLTYPEKTPKKETLLIHPAGFSRLPHPSAIHLLSPPCHFSPSHCVISVEMTQ